MSEKSSRSNSEFEFIGSPELEPVRSPFSDDDITEYLENLDISNSEESTNIRELENALNLARKDAAELRAKKFSNSELRKQNSQLQERVDELLAEVNRRIVGEEVHKLFKCCNLASILKFCNDYPLMIQGGKIVTNSGTVIVSILIYQYFRRLSSSKIGINRDFIGKIVVNIKPNF